MSRPNFPPQTKHYVYHMFALPLAKERLFVRVEIFLRIVETSHMAVQRSC